MGKFHFLLGQNLGDEVKIGALKAWLNISDRMIFLWYLRKQRINSKSNNEFLKIRFFWDTLYYSSYNFVQFWMNLVSVGLFIVIWRVASDDKYQASKKIIRNLGELSWEHGEHTPGTTKVVNKSKGKQVTVFLKLFYEIFATPQIPRGPPAFKSA